MATSSQSAADHGTREELVERLTELEAEKAAKEYARRAALNLAEDAILAKRQADELNEQLKQEIAERTRVEATLRENESRLHLIQSAGGIGGFDYDLQKDAAVCSPEYYSMFGLPDGAPVDKQTWPPLVHPEDRERILRLFTNAIRNGQTVSYEFRIIRPDNGEVRWISGRAAALFDEEGRSWRLVGGIIDFTDRKLSEARAAFRATLGTRLVDLSSPEELMRVFGEEVNGLLGASVCTFVEIDPAMGEVNVTADWHREGGKSLLGTYELREYVKPEFQEMMAAGNPVIIRDVGTDARVEDPAKLAALKIGALVNIPVVRLGRWEFAIGIYHERPYIWRDSEVDLMLEAADRIWTHLERARAERALRESEEKYRTLFETIDEGFALIELERDESGKINDIIYREVNHSFERHTGLADAVGKRVTEMFPNLDRSVIDIIQHVSDTGEPYRAEINVADIGRWFSVRYSRVGEAGGPNVAGVFEDITERKVAEEAERRKAAFEGYKLKLADALRSIGNPESIQFEAARVLGEHLGVHRVAYFELEGSEYVVLRDYHDENSVSLIGRYPVDIYGPWQRGEYEAGRVVVVTDTSVEPNFSEPEREAFVAIGVLGYIAAPLVKDGRLVACLGVYSPTPRRWTQEEIDLVKETAERTWAAVERARSETALRASEEKYRTLFDSMDEGYCIIEMISDNDGDPVDYRFIEVNSAFERQAGIKDVVGKRMLEFVPEIENHWLENYGSVARTGHPVRFANEYKGLNKWFDVYAFRPSTWEGPRIAVLFTDITPRVVAEEKLREAHEELEDRVQERTRELAQTNEVLSVEIEERRELERVRGELLQRIVTAQEEERRRISRDLHDHLGQQLTALRLKLSALSSAAGEVPAMAVQVRRLQEIADSLDREISFLSSELRPTVLDDLGLEEALRAYTSEWSEHFGVGLDFHSNFGTELRVASQIETHLYRIAQEALNNAAKHSRAEHVAVLLERTADGVVLVVEDNGVGFDPQNAVSPEQGHGLGMVGMRERANLIRGEIEVESAPGRGTTVYVKVRDRD
jgi:PAS domain S-box-containing protein